MQTVMAHSEEREADEVSVKAWTIMTVFYLKFVLLIYV